MRLIEKTFTSKLVSNLKEATDVSEFPSEEEYGDNLESNKEDTPYMFEYSLLDRLRSDCDYYLGNGNRNEKNLWAKSPEKQIEKMRSLWKGFPEDMKPEWLSIEDIDNYEKAMIKKTPHEVANPEEDLINRKIIKESDEYNVSIDNLREVKESLDYLIEKMEAKRIVDISPEPNTYRIGNPYISFASKGFIALNEESIENYLEESTSEVDNGFESKMESIAETLKEHGFNEVEYEIDGDIGFLIFVGEPTDEQEEFLNKKAKEYKVFITSIEPEAIESRPNRWVVSIEKE